jgi:hypothetical protein
MNGTNNVRKDPHGREFTYQVGWRRGTIRDRGQPSGTEHSLPGFAEKRIWRPLPALPAKWMPALLWAVPVLSFAITYVLVSALMHAQ